MYSFEDFKTAVTEPHQAFREFNRIWYTRGKRREYNPDGIDVFDEDWDNLIILDACRYDAFTREIDLPGRTEARTSRAGTTKEWVRANFQDRQLDDTIYLTNNGFYLSLQNELNSDIFGLYYINYEPNRKQEVEITTETALNLASEYPNKRLVVHYLPPHMPYIGDTAAEHLPPFEKQMDGVFRMIQTGEISISDELLHEVYVENLRVMIEPLERLLDAFEGKTVISADHGELLGERVRPIPMKEYGHHNGIYAEPLVQVPWHVVPADSRKTIIEDRENGFVEKDYTDEHTPENIKDFDRVLDQHLENLGYKM